jgi:hypothetical protein
MERVTLPGASSSGWSASCADAGSPPLLTGWDTRGRRWAPAKRSPAAVSDDGGAAAAVASPARRSAAILLLALLQGRFASSLVPRKLPERPGPTSDGALRHGSTRLAQCRNALRFSDLRNACHDSVGSTRPQTQVRFLNLCAGNAAPARVRIATPADFQKIPLLLHQDNFLGE